MTEQWELRRAIAEAERRGMLVLEFRGYRYHRRSHVSLNGQVSRVQWAREREPYVSIH